MDSANFLQLHLETEGLFRKSGSIQRQKVLKVRKNIQTLTTAQPTASSAKYQAIVHGISTGD